MNERLKLSKRLAAASRVELIRYLHGRGVGGYEGESTDQIRVAALVDASEAPMSDEPPQIKMLELGGDWNEHIMGEIAKWRRDPNYLPILPVKVENDALEDAADKIADLCGCPEWEYPGQLVRDVATVVGLLLEIEQRLRPNAAAGSLEVREWLDKVERLNLKLEVVAGAERYGEG